MKIIIKLLLILTVILTVEISGFATEQNSDPAKAGDTVSSGLSTNTGSIFKGSGSSSITPLPVSMPKFSVWRSIGAMLVVIGGLLAVNSYVNKRRDSLFLGRNRNKRIVILERTAIDHRRSLLLVEADGQRIVLGLGPDRMETVAVLSGKASDSVGVTENDTGKGNPSFSDSLKTLIGRGAEAGRT